MIDRRFRIYIAGPMTNGNTLDRESIMLNADRAAQVGAELLKQGFAPLMPQLAAGHACLMEGVHWAHWLEADFAWIRMSDAVLRLPGKSKGTDEEIEFATQIGVPVFTSLGDLVVWRDQQYAAATI
jgi:uncharacterized protein DUF4406